MPETTAVAARTHPDGMAEVVMTDGVLALFERWLNARRLWLFPIPVEDDLPTYGITPIRPGSTLGEMEASNG